MSDLFNFVRELCTDPNRIATFVVGVVVGSTAGWFVAWFIFRLRYSSRLAKANKTIDAMQVQIKDLIEQNRTIPELCGKMAEIEAFVQEKREEEARAAEEYRAWEPEWQKKMEELNQLVERVAKSETKEVLAQPPP